MQKISILLLLLCFSTSSLYSQNKTIKGRVIDNHSLNGVAGLIIKINETIYENTTDLDGFFQIDIPITVKKIQLMAIGFELRTIEFIDTCNEIEVIMIYSATYDFKTPQKVNKLELKEFKKLPKLHKAAFVKGIFNTEKACYTQAFIPKWPSL